MFLIRNELFSKSWDFTLKGLTCSRIQPIDLCLEAIDQTAALSHENQKHTITPQRFVSQLFQSLYLDLHDAPKHSLQGFKRIGF